jgi:ribokinase
MNMDLVVRCAKLPQPGETAVGGGYKTYPGGKGANQAVAAARQGAAVCMVARLGDDAHGPRLLDALKVEGVDVAHVVTSAETASGLALITVAEGGENMIVVSAGANALLTPTDIESARPAIEGAAVLLLQLEVPIATVIAAARVARGAGASVILNAAPARVLPAELLALVDVLVVNRSEAATLTGLDAGTDPGRLALRLADLGPATAVLTLGQQGAIVAHRGRPRRISGMMVASVDAVGAGDAFCGALATVWAEVAPLVKAKAAEEMNAVERVARRACVAGALATLRAGAMPSMPTRSDVDAALAQG